MTEALLIPVGVAVNAHAAQATDLSPCRMTRPAVELAMVVAEGPAGAVVGEARPFLGIVALGTVIVGMALVAGSMQLLLCEVKLFVFVEIVAVATILVTMAVYALEAEQFYMLLVLKSHDGILLVRRLVRCGNRYGNGGMRSSHDIGRVRYFYRQKFSFRRDVAHDTLRVVTPFAVTRETLPVVGSFEIGFRQIGRSGFRIVTLST